MLPDTGIDDVKKQRNAEYAKHINDPVLSSLKMEGIRLLFSSESKRRNNFGISCLISDFRREVDENFTLLGYYAANSGNSLPTFRDLGYPETVAMKILDL
jgi:hypothetical protein